MIEIIDNCGHRIAELMGMSEADLRHYSSPVTGAGEIKDNSEAGGR